MAINKKSLITVVLLLFSCGVYADTAATCGATDYSGSSGRLYDMVIFVLAVASSLLQLMYAIATLLALYNATGIYIKMQAGEEGFAKSVIMLVGSVMFLIGATIVMPAFFGFQYGTTSLF